jgi:hypothetical protein
MPSLSIASSSSHRSHQVHPEGDEHALEDGHGQLPPTGGNREPRVAFTSPSARGEFVVVIDDSAAGGAHGTSNTPAPATSSRLSQLIGGVRQWAHTQSQHLKGADLAKAAATEFVRAYLTTALGKTVGGLVEQQVENWVLPRPTAQFALTTAWPAASAVVNAAFAGYAVYGIVKAFEKPERPRNQLAVAAGGAAAGVASLLAVGPVTALVSGAPRANAARFAAEQLNYAIYAMVREAAVFASSGLGPELKSRKEDGSTGSLKLSFGSVAISVPLYSASSIAMNFKGSTAFKNRFDPPTLANSEGGELRHAAVMQKGIAFDKMFANPFVEGLHQAVVVLAKAAVGHAPTVVMPQSGWVAGWRSKHIKAGTPAARPDAPSTEPAPRFQFSTWTGALALKAVPNAMSRIVSNSIPDSPLSVWQAKHPAKHDVIRLLKAAFIAISDYRSWMLVETATHGHERVDGVLEASARPRPEESWRDESLGRSSHGTESPQFTRADSVGADSIRTESPRAWDADDEREMFYDSSSEDFDTRSEALGRRQEPESEVFYESSSEDSEGTAGTYEHDAAHDADSFFDSSSEDFGAHALPLAGRNGEAGDVSHREDTEGHAATDRPATEEDDAAFLDRLLDAEGDRLTSVGSDSEGEIDAHTFDRLLEESTPQAEPAHVAEHQAEQAPHAEAPAHAETHFHDDWQIVPQSPPHSTHEQVDEHEANAGRLVATQSRPQYFVEMPEDTEAHAQPHRHEAPRQGGPLGSAPHDVHIEEVDPRTHANVQPHFVEAPGSARVFVEGRRAHAQQQAQPTPPSPTRIQGEREGEQRSEQAQARPHMTMAEHLAQARQEEARRARTEAPARRDHARQVLEQNGDLLRQTIDQLETQRHLENLRDQMQARTQGGETVRRRRGPLAKVRNAFRKLSGSR